MCIYMYKSTDKVEKLLLYLFESIFENKMDEETGGSQILVLNMYPICYTRGNNLEGYCNFDNLWVKIMILFACL